MRLVLLHYHILKNGGSTIEEILRRSFGERFLTFDLPHPDAEVKSDDLLSLVERNPHLDAFSSHQIFYPVPQVPGFLFFDICFLRDPLDRIRSSYDYFRGKPTGGDPVRELANQHTLGEFTRHLIEEMPWTVNDVQVNLLANGIVNDQPGGVEDLEVATVRMRETSFLGVVDRFNESLVAGQHALKVLFPTLDCAQEPVNDSARPGSTLAERMEDFRRACDGPVFAELLRLNAMDFELLHRARAEVRRRFDLVPGCALIPEPREATKPGSVVTTSRLPAPGPFTRLTRWLRFVTDIRAVRPGSQFRRMFDAHYYLESYPDVKATGANPLWHFVTRGAFEGRNPHPLFDTKFYLSQCANSPSSNALSDYLEHGDAKGRLPHPLFDPAFYTRRYPDVRQARMNPLLHYMLHGAVEGRKPHPLFQPDYYLKLCPSARNAENPLVYFAAGEPTHWCNPHPLFDCQAYLHDHPQTAGNPLLAYLVSRQARSSETIEAAHFVIEDVEVEVVFPESEFLAPMESGEAAIVWPDASGMKQFRCASQQRPFFECARYDQLAAQIKRPLPPS